MSGTPSRSASRRVASDVGHCDHVEPGTDALRQKLDEVLGGRARAEAKPHARTDEFDGTGSGCAFLSIGIHAIETVGPRDCINDGRLSSPVRPESIVHLPATGGGGRSLAIPPITR